MLSSSRLQPSAPSATLLRFLRSQSDFLSVNSSTCAPPPRSKPYVHRRLPCDAASRPSSTWACTASTPRRATLQTSLDKVPSLAARSYSSPRPQIWLCTGQSSIPPFSNAPYSRSVSTKSRPLLRRLFDLRRSKSAPDKHNSRGGPALIDDGTEGGFNIGRGLAAKVSNELRLRCTEFDKNGNVTLVNGEFKKSELIAKVRFHLHDSACGI
jgi:magnesium transporter